MSDTTKKKAIVKFYNWQALAKLALKDMREQLNLSEEDADVHYIGGLDTRKNPFMRFDVTPMKGWPRFKD